nr:hypothetical protein [Tanacetum cinerariifolium]
MANSRPCFPNHKCINDPKEGNPQHDLKDKGVIDSGCSRYMTENMSYLSDFQELNGGYVAFGGVKVNLFSVSQMCDKKNSVLFTDTKCLVLSPDFKPPDESQVLLRVPRENNMYNVNLKSIVSFEDLTCLFPKATINESNLWHRRLGHINFKTINKLLKDNFVRGLPTKVFVNDNNCVACKKGKQHRAACKTKPVSSIDQPLYRLHMDLFGPTFVKSLNKKCYCLVVTDDYSRFTWVFFLATKDETSPILKTFITGLENQLSLKVKVIKSDNGTEFKNNDLNQLCGMKGIKREFSVPRTLSKMALLRGKTEPSLRLLELCWKIHFYPFHFRLRQLILLVMSRIGYSLGKFNGKVDEGFLVGYSVSSKAFRVFNSRTRIVQETLHVNFLKNKPNIASSGPTWLFDIDSLTRTMNYQPVTAGNQTNPSAGFQDKFDAEKAGEEIDQQYLLFPVWSFGFTNPQNNNGYAAFDGKEHDIDAKKHESEVNVSLSSSAQSKKQDDKTKIEAKGKSHVESFTGYRDLSAEFKDCFDNNINEVNAAELEDNTYSDDEDDVGAEANFNNLETSIIVSPIPTTRIHKNHPVSQIIGDLSSTTQTRSMTKVVKDQGGLSQMFNDDFHTWFEDTDHPNKVYKVIKVLYGLHQAPRAWYETLANYLLENGFQRRKIDQTLFIKRQKGDILLVQIYVDDIIFGATNKDLCKYFEKLMKDKFQMSSMGELTFFLGLQVKKKKDGIFISQDKYVAEILRKLGLTEGKSASAPIDTEKPLLKDLDGGGVNTPRSNEDMLELMELIVFLLLKVKKVRIRVNAVDLQVSTVNDITRLQALLDRKKVVVTKATIRESLHLDDAEGVDGLPNEEIFTELARMGYKKPSTKLTFYKAFFSIHLIRNVDSTIKFYMYPHFLQLIIRKQVGDLSTHTTKYTLPALTQKVFANMRRVGKGFSGVETPLFEGMLVEQQGDKEEDADENIEEVNAGDAAEGDDSAAHGKVPPVAEEQSILSPTPPTPPLQPPQDIPSTSQVQQTPPQSPQVQPPSPQPQPQPQQAAKFPMSLFQEVMDTCVALTRRVEYLEFDKDDAIVLENDMDEDRKVVVVVINVEEAKVDETQVPVATTATLTAAPTRVVVAPSRRRKGVVIRDPEEESTTSIIIPAETKSKDKGKGILVEEPKPLKKKQQIEQDEQYAKELHAKLNKDIDWDEAIDLVKRKAKEDPAIKKYQAMKRKPQTKAQARKNMMMYLKNVVGFKLDYFKGMSYNDIRPIFEAKFNSNVAFLLKTKEQIEEDKNRTLQKINETPAERATKRRKLDEDVEDIKIHLQIVPNEDDDVYTEATPLARKVPIVDYEIIEMNNKPYYKIIRADGTHQLYISFLTLLRNFDREDLEALWSLVKERFSTAKPKNFFNDFLLTTLGAMFEMPDAHAQIWKNQRSVHGQVKVKSWKLLESSGVQIITFTTTQLILLVERRYPLLRFTLNQMLNASSDDKAEDDKTKDDTGSKTVKEPVNQEDQAYRDELDRLMSQEKKASDAADALRKEFKYGCMDQIGVTKVGSTNSSNTVSKPVNAASISGTFSTDRPSSLQNVGAEVDFNNMESSTIVNPIPINRVHLDHPKDHILGDPKSVVQTRGMAKKSSRAHAFVSYIQKQRRKNHKDYENCLFACFLSQMEPKKVSQALDDESWVEEMQEELL